MIQWRRCWQETMFRLSFVVFSLLGFFARGQDANTITVATFWNGTTVGNPETDYFNVTFGLSASNELEVKCEKVS